MVTDGPRSPLADLDTQKPYAASRSASSVTIIPADESADGGNKKATADPVVEEPSPSS
jgi:hypothetical protein